MASASLSSDFLQQDTADQTRSADGRPMFGLALGVLISLPLWVGLWCACQWI